jgi:penicillin-binding protein 1C
MKKNSLRVVSLLALFLWGNFFLSYPLSHTTEYQYEHFEEIPENLRQAILSIEDRRFFFHPGIDPIAIWRALKYNLYDSLLVKGGVGRIWASTIDQQVIKLTQQAFTRSRTQKIREQFLALNLQFHYSKEEIFVHYINTIPFSHGIQGWKQACDIYVQKSCHLLNTPEMSYLLAVSQLGINPYKDANQEAILKRAKVICSKLTKEWENNCSLLDTPNYIDLSFKETPLDPRIELFLKQEKLSRSPLLKAKGNNSTKIIVPEQSEGEGFFNQEVYTSIQSILTTTKSLRDQYHVKDCCIVIVDKDWKLISMNICNHRSDPEAGKINLCLQARQTGSAIKPFLYLYAMMTKRLKAEDTIVDEPVQYHLWDGSLYEPKNFDLKHHGKVTLAYALGNSLNIPAIKLTDMVGVKNFYNFLREQLSIYASWYDHNEKNPENLGLSIGLGTYEISPYAFTKLRTLFIHEKQTFSPWQGGYGEAEGVREIFSILSNPSNKVHSFWQDSFLNTPWWAVKTGTSRKFIDGRVCGVHSDKGLSMCIRMGNYDNQAMKGASSEVVGYVWNLVTKELQ